MANFDATMLSNGREGFTRRAVLGGLTFSLPPIAHMLPHIHADITAAEPPVHPVLTLPFVTDSNDEERASGANPRCFWTVEPTSNYRADCETGAHFAALALDYMVATRSPHLLTWSIIDMMALNRRHSGIEVGFVSAFGRLATVAHAARTASREGGMA